jgi:hypothetical protein
MARLRLDISEESYLRLMEIATLERRPIDWQAEVMLIRAIADYYAPALRPEPLAGLMAGERDDGAYGGLS